MMSGALADLRDACRALRQAPGQTLTVFVCLTLGSTLTVLMFGVVNAMLAGEVPGVRDRARLVHVLGETAGANHLHRLTAGDYRGLPPELPGVAAMAAEEGSRGFAVNLDGLAITIQGRYVNGSYFQALGTQPSAGRLLIPSDDIPTAPPVAVLSYRFSRQHFGDPHEAVGRVVRNGLELVTVVGVLPPGFAGLQPAGVGYAAEDQGDMWLPMSRRRGVDAAMAVHDDQIGPAVVARLADGVNRGEVEARLQYLVDRFNAERPRRDRLGAVRLVSFHLFDPSATVLDRLAGAASLMAVPFIILTLASANVAAVYLSRALGRTHELAVRISLGATRLRVARLLALETGLVAMTAGLAAWGISTQALRLSGRILPIVVTADVRVFLFSLLLPLAVTVMAGLLPAWRATGFDVLAGLRLGARIGGSIRPGARTAVLVGQIAVSIALLATAASLVRAFTAGTEALGRSQDDVLVAEVRFLNVEISPEREAQSRRDILEQARRIPGVAVVAAGERLLSQSNQTAARAVSDGWFDAIGLRVLAGRGFRANDADVAVVNETWARSVGGASAAIGARIQVQVRQDRRTVDVVGVVEDGYERVAWSQDVPVAYVPMAREQSGEFTLYLRGPGAAAAGPAVSKVVASVHPSLSPSAIGTVTELVRMHYRGSLGVARALAVLSGIAVILVVVGLFGATAHAVARRRHEFGVRLALGARPRAIGWLVLRETLVSTVSAGVIGVGLAAGLLVAVTPPNRSELDLHDPVPVVLAIGAIVFIGLAASAVPVRRVMAIDPAISLRSE